MLVAAAIAVAAVLTPLPDHLEAEGGVFGEFSAPEYHFLLLRLLLVDKYRWTQMVVTPSRDPEESVYIDMGERGSVSECTVVSTRLKRSLAAQMFHFTQIDPGGGDYLSKSDIEVEKRIATDHATAGLDRAVCDKLQAVWVAALLRVRAPDEPLDEIEIRVHGETYHFNTFSEGPGYRGGTCWHPDSGTKMAGLVKLAKELITFARSRAEQRQPIAQNLADGATKLLTRFEKEEPLPARGKKE